MENKTDNKKTSKNSTEENSLASREKEILKFWRKQRIFEKTLEKKSSQGNFIFYEGPPTANGRPGIHHLESRAFKDLIPRYKTMRGYNVRRKAGWDTHGLPVEIEVEKELGLKSKKEIEEYGIAEFNQKCKENVWKYVKEWEEFTDRIGYWVDLDHAYVTYKPYYIESVWNIVKEVDKKNLLYKDYKVLPWCPRCGTALSSHELAQGYKDVKDLSVTVKLELKESPKTFVLAWTTTPWTLPGNIALAVGKEILYVKVKAEEERLILAKDRLSILDGTDYEVLEEFKGEKLLGLKYEPPYPFLKDSLPGSEKEKIERAFKIYPADFVTTEEGTGIVHTAVMYGQDDFQLGTKEDLPKYHLVNENGTFKGGTDFLAGRFVKDQETDVEIIKDLTRRNLLLKKEKYQHSYPHCWRCKTPLIYYARDSWYIKMSKLRHELIEENEKINWEPKYIKKGRFGEWLSEVKDWAISRERFWGTPLPVWQCHSCPEKEVIGSFGELFSRNTGNRITKLILVRHGESQKNIKELFDSSHDAYSLTPVGEDGAKKAGEIIKKNNINTIYSSPVRRARETAGIIGKITGVEVVEDELVWEVRNGEWEGKRIDDPTLLAEKVAYNKLPNEDYYRTKRGGTGESWKDVEKRMADWTSRILRKHKGETVVVVSHEGPLMMLLKHIKGLSLEEITNLWDERRIFHRGLLGGYAEPAYVYIDNDTGKEIDPHRPFIDGIKLTCKCGGEMTRVREVMDVWFDSGSMPFAQDHYPFKNKEWVEEKGFPADFISEAIDQTRGWFYTLHAVGILLGKGRAYRNVISLGLLLDAEGKKMSKSIGNVVNPWEMADKYGVDVLRFWMYSINKPGEPKNFDQKTVQEVQRKVFNLLLNAVRFYEMYGTQDTSATSQHVLDRWITAEVNKLTREVGDHLDNYKIMEAARSVRDFIIDFSQWYIRRSRERFRGKDREDKANASATTRFVLLRLSKLMAPFTPFLAEDIFQRVKNKDSQESVHLEEWPKSVSSEGLDENKLLEHMKIVREIVSLSLEQRSRSGIKVRQPLSLLKVKKSMVEAWKPDDPREQEQFLELIKDEVNVKEVVFDDAIAGDVFLDTEITQELVEEGRAREFVRLIQDIRKKKGLNIDDFVVLEVGTNSEGERLIENFQELISNSASLKSVNFTENPDGEKIEFDGLSFSVNLKN